MNEHTKGASLFTSVMDCVSLSNLLWVPPLISTSLNFDHSALVLVIGHGHWSWNFVPSLSTYCLASLWVGTSGHCCRQSGSCNVPYYLYSVSGARLNPLGCVWTNSRAVAGSEAASPLQHGQPRPRPRPGKINVWMYLDNHFRASLYFTFCQCS